MFSTCIFKDGKLQCCSFLWALWWKPPEYVWMIWADLCNKTHHIEWKKFNWNHKTKQKKNTRHVENPDCREAEQLALYKIRLWAWALELKLIYLKELKTVSPTACHLQGSAPPKKCEKLKHLRNVFFHSQQSMQSRFRFFRCVCTSKQLLVWVLS